MIDRMGSYVETNSINQFIPKLASLSKRMMMWILGKGSQRSYRKYITLVICYVVISSYIAQSMFPVKFDIFEHHVSQQGGYANNPDGHIIWNVMMIASGFLYFPYMFHIFQRVNITHPTRAKLAHFFSFLGNAGLTFVGIYPEDIEIPHQIAASFAIFGYFTCANIYWLGLYRELGSKKRIFLFHLIYTFINCSFFFMVLRLFIEPSTINFSFDVRWFDFQIWEWMITYALLVWVAFIQIFIPKKEKMY